MMKNLQEYVRRRQLTATPADPGSLGGEQITSADSATIGYQTVAVW